jgi:hypothetical protein
MEKEQKDFPNGFSSWQETHFQVVMAITIAMQQSEGSDNKAHRTSQRKGIGGLYTLAENLTDKFENLHKNRKWDGEFFDEIEKFLITELEIKNDEKWYEAKFAMSDGTEVHLVHNIPQTDGSINSLQAAFDNWIVRTNTYTTKSFVDYINSKTHMSGHRALTWDDYQKLIKERF